MASLNILIGIEFFRRVREENHCYVDKTGFIEELLASNQAMVSLITRPRRFGKTLTMTMLQEFFDICQDSRAIFEGLAVSRNTALCQRWMNQYPTVFMTLKGVEGRNYDFALSQVSDLLQNICIEHTYLLESEKVAPATKNKLARLYNGETSEKDMASSMRLLCRALEAHWEKPVILLIDEYDTPVNCAEQNGYYITGLNNFKCFGISNSRFADKFGFTPQEVKVLLDRADLSTKETELKEWYDGYRFGGYTEVYCPWDVLQYLSDLQYDAETKPQAYWNNTSSNSIVKTLISRADHRVVRDKIERLIEGGSVQEELAEELTYDTVYKNERNLWTILYLTGYLTKASKQPDNDLTALVVPNKAVRQIFIKTVSRWFEDKIAGSDLSSFAEALWNGNAAGLQQMLTQILYGTISYFDGAENYYHGFMTGLIRGAGLSICSNDEIGLGRADIVIEDSLNRRAIIIELKYTREFKDLEAKAEEALKQIEERKYALGLGPLIKKIINYGIAFWKKESCVKASEVAQ